MDNILLFSLKHFFLFLNVYEYIYMGTVAHGNQRAGDSEDTAYEEMVPETKQLVLRQHQSKRPEWRHKLGNKAVGNKTRLQYRH